MSKNELIIKKENEIIIIRKENIQRLVHESEYSHEGFVMSSCFGLDCTFKPIFTQPAKYFAVMTNGYKFNLTKKQYQTIKKWY